MTKIMNDRVSVSIEGGIADVRLNRPDKMNALDVAMFHAIDAAMQDLAARRDVRCVVLSGEGRAFCAGIDLAALTGAPELKDLTPRTHGEANLFQNIAWGWHKLPVPVIAAVHGVAFGGGFQMMLGADIRIAAPTTELSMMEIRWGLVPDVAGMALMRGLVRDDVARDITFSGRRFSGSEATELGLVTRLTDDPLAAALDLALVIASSSPDAIRAAKRLLNLPPETSSRDILIAESVEQAAMLASANHREALAAAAAKRAPVYRDIEG
jgi:enoyl-CoA hydratase/carnithine racemase